jgi:CheY-like chemotaxis protein
MIALSENKLANSYCQQITSMDSRSVSTAPKRILVIDDEEDIREVTKLCLEMMGGWEVSTADSGRQGLALAAAEQPDAIILDLMMPELDGVATLSRLQANPTTEHIPVIFLTAHIQASNRRGFSELGATAVMPKPFDPIALASQVARILGWNQSDRR